jgi:bZIP-type transcription factor MBZ1
VAVKIEEANDLRAQNRQLMEENTRLTDLTRMLLSSQAFSGFLTELSGTGLASSSNTLPSSQSQPRPQPQPTQKDVNPQQLARQLHTQQHQIGIATVPETPVNFPLFETVTSSWNSDVGPNNFPVYSLTSLSDGPALDVKMLSGKGEESCPFRAPNTVKSDVPLIEHAKYSSMTLPPAPFSSPRYLGSDFDADEPGFQHYPGISSTLSDISPSQVGFVKDGIVDVKMNRLSSNLSLDVNEVEPDAGSRLELMCARLDAISARIAAVTSHLT